MVLKDRKKEWVFLLPLLLQWIVYLLLRTRLPAEIETHFTINEHGDWIANGFMSPGVMQLLTSAIYLLVFFSITRNTSVLSSYMAMRYNGIIKGLVLGLVAGIDIMLMLRSVYGKPGSAPMTTPAVLLLSVIINVFIFFVFRYGMPDAGKRPLTPVYYNLVWGLMHLVVTYTTLMPLLRLNGLHLPGSSMHRLLLAVFTLMGNITYNVKPNSFIGIRNSWTLSNEQVWRKTHHLSGMLFFITGLSCFILSFFLPPMYAKTMLTIVVVSGAVIPFIYSYFLYRNQTTP